MEFQKLLAELADDLCCGWPLGEHGSCEDRAWFEKYIEGKISAKTAAKRSEI